MTTLKNDFNMIVEIRLLRVYMWTICVLMIYYINFIYRLVEREGIDFSGMLMSVPDMICHTNSYESNNCVL